MLTRRRILIASICFGLVPVLAGTALLVRGNPGRITTTMSTSTTTTTFPEETTTSSTTSTTVEETTTTSTTATPVTVPRSTTTTVAEPILCPGLPHPAHHQPCPEEEPSAPPATAPPAPVPAAPGGCEQAMIGVRAVGLPDGWSIFCSAEKTQGHAGLAYWNAPGGSYIAMNPSTGNYPGVGAHEACHAWDYAQRGATSEGAADACALAHGYPNPYAGADDILDFFMFPEVPSPLP